VSVCEVEFFVDGMTSKLVSRAVVV
jgi:hypothetical protein